MTTPPTDTGTGHAAAGPTGDTRDTRDTGAVPPPGCPAHSAYADSGVARLSSEEHKSDPMGMYARLRAEYGPVAPVLMEGDLPAWLVLGYRENLDVVRTPNRFSRDSRNWGSFRRGEVAPDSPLLPMVGWQPLCVFLDGEEAERLRGAVTDSLNRLDRRGVRRHVTRFANELIDDFAADGTADLVGQFAERLPMLVMTQLFGMKDEYGPSLVEATLDLVRGSETAFQSNEYVVEVLKQYIPLKRDQPGHDIGSWLMEHPAGLSDEEVLQHLRLILIAANENTTICIGNTVRMVLSDLRFRASLAGARMTLPDAVEQVLWDEPSLMVCPARWAVGDTELADRQIKTGDMILLGLAAGNTDPDIRPDLSVPMRGNRSHLAFGGGPHECPGQDIGRAITETAVDVLLARLPDIRLAGEDEELVWVSSWMSRHLTALPVVFSPRPPAVSAERPPAEVATARARAQGADDRVAAEPVWSAGPGAGDRETAVAGQQGRYAAAPPVTAPLSGSAAEPPPMPASAPSVGDAPTAPARRSLWRRFTAWLNGQ
ncbi:cytochrome P450 [Yinghuangia sp. YIM S09857]|uniref:cytochrome P450 n=1 Tax=Yinghuangia sp. YIM S09857 TaxID=3436929 RepID=UPI003F53340D